MMKKYGNEKLDISKYEISNVDNKYLATIYVKKKNFEFLFLSMMTKKFAIICSKFKSI